MQRQTETGLHCCAKPARPVAATFQPLWGSWFARLTGQANLGARLRDDHGVTADPAVLSRFLRRRGAKIPWLALLPRCRCPCRFHQDGSGAGVPTWRTSDDIVSTLSGSAGDRNRPANGPRSTTVRKYAKQPQNSIRHRRPPRRPGRKVITRPNQNVATRLALWGAGHAHSPAHYRQHQEEPGWATRATGPRSARRGAAAHQARRDRRNRGLPPSAARRLTLRDSSASSWRLTKARLTAIKTLVGFDFAFQLSLDKDRIMALAELRFFSARLARATWRPHPLSKP